MKKDNLHIGILGLGNRSTVFYIEEMNRKYNVINGGYSTCPFILLNTNFNNINHFLPNKFKELKKNLFPYFKVIKKLSINTLLIPNITLHETIDMLDINLKLEVSIIHPVKNTIALLKVQKQDNVILFGSLYSMRSSYITSELLKNNIKCYLPSEIEMEFIDDLRQKIFESKESSEEINEYKQLIKRYAANTAVVIACTELSLTFDETNTNVFDMARIQIDEALKIIN